MKLMNFVENNAASQKLRDLGKSLSQPSQPSKMSIVEQKKELSPKTRDTELDGMDAAIHTLTQDQKHLHKKLASHD